MMRGWAWVLCIVFFFFLNDGIMKFVSIMNATSCVKKLLKKNIKKMSCVLFTLWDPYHTTQHTWRNIHLQFFASYKYLTDAINISI